MPILNVVKDNLSVQRPAHKTSPLCAQVQGKLHREIHLPSELQMLQHRERRPEQERKPQTVKSTSTRTPSCTLTRSLQCATIVSETKFREPSWYTIIFVTICSMLSTSQCLILLKLCVYARFDMFIQKALTGKEKQKYAQKKPHKSSSKCCGEDSKDKERNVQSEDATEASPTSWREERSRQAAKTRQVDPQKAKVIFKVCKNTGESIVQDNEVKDEVHTSQVVSAVTCYVYCVWACCRKFWGSCHVDAIHVLLDVDRKYIFHISHCITTDFSV